MTINIVIKPHRITVKSQDVESIKQTYIIKPKKEPILKRKIANLLFISTRHSLEL